MQAVSSRAVVSAWEERFPALFTEEFVEVVGADVRFGVEEPPDALMSRIHVVGRCDGGVVVCRSDLGHRFLPGGTREPGETVEQTVDRELREEAGATRTSALSWFGAHRADSHSEQPWRPHLPHPRAYWPYAAADVVLDSAPTNPPDGEQVVEVLVLPPGAAADYVAVHDSIHADLIRLAAAMGLA